MAKDGIKSSIVFWPEFLRQAFYDDFDDKFEYVKKVPILLIDDIFTTGSTVEECCRVLKNAGVKSIVVATSTKA